jgi:phage terminase large subunit-like protein
MAKRQAATRSQQTDAGPSDFVAIANAYAKEAVADKKQKKFCKWVRLCAKRHLEDLKKSGPDWPYKFDPWHGNDVCDFIQKLPHIKGKWETPTLKLEPAQIFILVVVFGWRRKDSGGRRFRSVYIEMARKGAKSTLTAGVSLYCLTCEGEEGPEVIIGATTGEQAGKVFEPAKKMVDKTAALREAFGLQTFARSVTCAANNGFMQPINAKGKTQDGWNPHVGILDELHAHKDRALYDVIRSAFGSRSNPLMWVITTAGFDTSGVCYEQRAFVIKVLEGTITADHYFGIIFTIDTADDYDDGRKDGDDPYDERVWIKANPMLGVTPSLTEMRTLAIDAKASPAAEGGFQTKNLNIWLNAASRWLNMAQWKRCERVISWEDFDGLECWIGGDLADKDDITALVLAAFDKDGRLIWKPVFWLPEAVLRPGVLKDDQMHLYRGWVKGKHLRVTPGDWVDHNEVEAQIDEWVKRYSIRHVTADAFAAFQQMAVRLNEKHASPDRPIASVLPKTAKNVTDAAKELEKRVKAGPHMFGHDGNPIMTWMAANTCVSRRRDETLLPIKETEMSPNKIDGIDAGINALAPAVIGNLVPEPQYQMIII